LQLRVHCAEALGTPIVGDYKYGWFVHQTWKQNPQPDFEPFTGEPYKLRRPEGLEIQKGSVLSKVPEQHWRMARKRRPMDQGEAQPPKIRRTNASTHEN